jgi:hypothetical protein
MQNVLKLSIIHLERHLKYFTNGLVEIFSCYVSKDKAFDDCYIFEQKQLQTYAFREFEPLDFFFFFTILLQLDQEAHGRFHVLHRSCRLMLGVGQKSMDCLANTGLLSHSTSTLRARCLKGVGNVTGS